MSNPYGQINLQEPSNPSVFRDLTSFEIRRVMNFINNKPEFNLTSTHRATVFSNYVFMVEAYIPNKQDVLLHLDDRRRKPAREARVVIHVYQRLSGIKEVREIIVGALPNPTYYRIVPGRQTPVPYIYLPQSMVQERVIGPKLRAYVDRVAGRMLRELYGGQMTRCGNRCIVFGFRTNLPTRISGKSTRLSWYWMEQAIEYYILHPIDMAILVEKIDENFIIHRVYLEEGLFDSLPAAVNFYYQNRQNFTRVQFPVFSNNLFSTLNQRGMPSFQTPLRNPTSVYPDGKRYNVVDRHVQYMFWNFEISFGTVNGPQLFDIRYKNERIAYELSLQEVAALYSGMKPFEQLDLLDSYMLLGTLTNYLVPGVDCPMDATFIGSYVIKESSDTPLHNRHAMCLFEHNTELPIRRHYTFSTREGAFYEGAVNTVLVARSILTVSNYDYFVDVWFYPNGNIEVKAIATGYISASFRRPRDYHYGFQLHDNVHGPLHHHLFHFKVDLDIKGRRNRYRTSEIVPDIVENKSYAKDANRKTDKFIYQNKVVHKTHLTERVASLQANTKTPKYLTIINEFSKDKYGNAAGFRILNRRPSELLRPLNSRKESALGWARYNVAVTRHKESERRSSSMYGYLDEAQAVVNFQKFVNDNERIVDQVIVIHKLVCKGERKCWRVIYSQPSRTPLNSSPPKKKN